MAGFSHQATLADGGLPFHSGIVAVRVIWSDGAPFLVAASGPDGGLTVYSLSGATPVLTDQLSYGGSGFVSPPVGLASFTLDTGPLVAPLGPDVTGLRAYGLTPDGTLGSTDSLLPFAGFDTYTSALASIRIGAQSYLYVAASGSGRIDSFAVDESGTLTELAPATTGTPFQGVSVPALATVTVGGTPVLLALSATGNQLESYLIGADGVATPMSRLGAADGLGIDAPTALVTQEVAGATYAVIAASGSSSLSVIEIAADGGLRPTDHVIDDLTTRFADVQSLDAVNVNGRVFLVAGGSDDGLSLFELLPGGRLLGVATVADTSATSLANVQAVAIAAASGGLDVFAASAIEDGLGWFNVATGPLSAPALGTASGDSMTGSVEGDLLMGAAGDDTISAGAGNDVLVDGIGTDRLTGGAGADTFVLIADGAVDYILDFETGIDRLDLSGFEMFYGIDQLDVTPTATGAQLRYRDETVIVTSATGMSLTAAHFALTRVVSLSRPSLQVQEAGLVISGTDDDDVQTGAAGADRLIGSAGTDHLDGGGGIDLVDYSASPAGVHVSLALGRMGHGGDAEGDSYTDIEDLAGSAHDDRMSGNDGANRLWGYDGNDGIRGEAGDDTIEGGSGDDRLSGVDGDDRLDGGDGADTLHGAAGADSLSGGLQDDLLYGGIGRDRLTGDAGNDRLSGGADDDVLSGGDGDDHLIGQTGDDHLDGGPGNDLLSGGYGADTLFGGAGADRMYGHDGADWLEGGPGHDILFGGAGPDTFIYRAGDGQDRIQDFDPALDLLMLDDAIWNGGLSASQVLTAFAEVTSGNVVLDFGVGQMITVAGMGGLEELVDALVIF